MKRRNGNLDSILLIVLAEAALLVGAWWVTKDWWLSAGLGFAAITTGTFLALGRAIGRKLNNLNAPARSNVYSHLADARQDRMRDDGE